MQENQSVKDDETGAERERVVLDNVLFHGSVRLSNGGIYPTVNTQYLLHLALSQIHLGQDKTAGIKRILNCQLIRNDAVSEVTIEPVDQILRDATQKLIEQVAKDAQSIYRLEWRDLERVMAQVYKEIGFHAELTEASQDGGKDIILLCLTGRAAVLRQRKYYVELKHWKPGLKVGTKLVEKLISVSVRDGVNGAVLIATSGFAGTVTELGPVDHDIHLGDLSSIHTLCRYHTASRSGVVFSTGTLEEINTLQFS